MEKEKIIGINLAFPCQQDWQNMKADRQRRVCEKCASCVHDFTSTTNEELTKILNNSSGLICGKFKRSQLSESFIKFAASTLLVTASLTLPALGQESTGTDSVNQTSNQEKEEQEFIGIVVEEQPVPKSGFKRLYKKIHKELKYPDQLTEGGKVFILFTVDNTGKVVDAEVLKGFNELADKEALRAFLAVDERFKPAKQRGKAVRVRMALPITFDPNRIKKTK